MIGKIIHLLHLATCVSVVVTWPSRSSYYDREIADALRITRRNHVSCFRISNIMHVLS